MVDLFWSISMRMCVLYMGSKRVSLRISKSRCPKNGKLWWAFSTSKQSEKSLFLLVRSEDFQFLFNLLYIIDFYYMLSFFSILELVSRFYNSVFDANKKRAIRHD